MTPNQLQAWMDRHKLSRAGAAKELGLNIRTLDGYRSGRRPIPPTVAVLAKVLTEYWKLKGRE